MKAPIASKALCPEATEIFLHILVNLMKWSLSNYNCKRLCKQNMKVDYYRI